jgi:arylsulfatase A-like enzyme
MKSNRYLLLVTGAACLSSVACKQQKDSRPNVLFIIADDFGYYDMSHTGSQYYETPHLDRLAANAMDFTHGYTTAPVCSPARASLMTGQFAPRHGITDYIGASTGEKWRRAGRNSKLLPPEYNRHLPFENVTLGNAMSEAGYKTLFVGKWHLGTKGSWPEDHGFHVNIGGWDGGHPRGGYFDPYDNPTLENRKPGESLSWRLADETAQYFRNNNPNETGQPIFAVLSFYAVHSPLQTTQEKWRKYRDKAENLGIAEYGFEMDYFLPNRLVQDNPIYGGLVETMDDAIGHVLDALEELDLDDNTIVIFTSDNGGVSAGDAFATSNLPFRNGKGYVYEGGLRVPFFIKVPGLTPRNIINETPVTGADIYPTILDMVGENLRPEEHADGISLLPLIRGEKVPERSLFWHYPHYGNQGGRPSSLIRKGNWKLIYCYETETHELYNLWSDISETRNLAALYPQKVEQLSEELFNYLETVGALYPEKDTVYSKTAERARMQRIREKRMPDLEQQRLDFLSPEYDPGNKWWGSQVD